jgi:hypothetical protein
LIERGKDTVLRLRKRKGKAVRNWRSRAWSIDPKKTNLIIIRTEILKPTDHELADLD